MDTREAGRIGGKNNSKRKVIAARKEREEGRLYFHFDNVATVSPSAAFGLTAAAMPIRSIASAASAAL
jgi:hypothetical protein